MFLVAMIGVPIVLAYTITIYYAFRGKVVLTKESY
jgi:cytochrome bd-type quinol oxidase subunit 2